jgi:carbamoyltransferase
MKYVLGLSGLYHDSAACLLGDGRILAAAQQERFSRLKHDAALPVRAAEWCLAEAGIEASQLEAVVWYEKPLRKLERMLVTQVLHFPKSWKAFTTGSLNFLTNKLWVGSTLCKELGIDEDRLLFSDHHQSHAASAFYASGWDEAAVLTVDGVGEWASTSLYRGGPDGLTLLDEVHFPHSLGMVYSAFTAFLGFRVNNGEYKVMGMAPYGTPRFVDRVRKVLRLREDGSFDIDPKLVSYHWSATDSYTRAFEELFGKPRFPGSVLDFSTDEGRFYADIAASVQRVLEDALLGVVRALHQRTGLSRLCMAGGVALNSVANHRVLVDGPFDELFVQPAAGDAGGAMGAALWAWNEVLGGSSAGGLKPGLGREWSDDETAEILGDLKVKSEVLDDAERVARASEDIAEGKVIGWVQGRFEWGPRALGHRSILADASRAGMKDHVNASIKFREAFRPFAPSVTAEGASRYFKLPEGGEQPLRWMLLVTPTVSDALPPVTHVDGSARVQVVHEGLYHDLIDAVGQRTDHPVVLNTSFNLKGEPIVSSPVQALATFRRSGLDVLYVGRHRISK